MNRIEFFGRIYTSDPDVVIRIFQAWIAPGDLDVKIRLSGEEIVYEDQRLYFFCYNAAGAPGGTPNYLLEGHTTRTLDETRSFLERLLQTCRDMQVTAAFDYVEVTETGEEVSEEFHVE